MFISQPLRLFFLLSALFSCVGTASVARRSLAAPMDSAVLSRLLTPTQASLARSKSAAALSADGADIQGNPREIKRPSLCRNPPFVYDIRRSAGVRGWQRVASSCTTRLSNGF